MFRFTLPRDIYVGHGAIEQLSVLEGHKKAFICTGGHSMRRGGFLQKTEEALHKAGIEHTPWKVSIQIRPLKSKRRR